MSANTAGVNPRSFSAASWQRRSRPVASLERHEVDEVACFGSSEHSEHLVDRQFLAAEHRGGPAGLGRKEPCVCRQVKLGPVLAAFHDESGETRAHLDVVDDETGVAKRPVDSGDEPVDRSCTEAEEVEIAGLTFDVAAGDQRGPAGEREAFGFLQVGDDLGDLFLQRAQHLRSTPVTLHPAGPRPSYCRREY